MKTLPFRKSAKGSIGVELELQIINPESYGLVSRAKDLMRDIKNSAYSNSIKPEITQSMIEINSSIHHSASELLDELIDVRQFLIERAGNINVLFCGGGTHPFQKWALQKIYPTMRYTTLSSKYRFLSKRSTVFGQHVHVGCQSADDAIYLTHALARYVPHFLAMSASSPFYQGIDTGYFSSRSTAFNSFPLSGMIPFVNNWQEFSTYFYIMKNHGIVTSMKDFYWDVRPKPEFGTVEVRVCDTPLTMKTAVLIAAYIQALSLYLLEERPLIITPELYYIYGHNRFEASRYGFKGELIDYQTGEKILIIDDILDIAKKIEKYANRCNSMGYISQLIDHVINLENDATRLRQLLKQKGSFQKVVADQCAIWSE
jgi:carboxylate-amine ligase